MYLVDTNVLSRVAPTKSDQDAKLTAWLERNGEQLYLSAVTVTEVTFGIAWLAHRGASRKADLLRAWLHDVLVFHQDRVISIDIPIARGAGELLARTKASGFDVGIEDALIAATAESRALTVLTANTRHFQPLGVAYLNPFETPLPD